MLHFGASMLSWIPQWTTAGGSYAIQKAASHGFDLLEISLPSSLDIDIPRLKREAAKAGIGIRFTLILPKEAHPTLYPKKALNHLEKALDLVQAAGGTFLGGVLYSSIGIFTGQPCTEAERKTVIAVIRQAADYAADKGITLALEPINRYETYILNTAANVLALIKEINAPNLELMLDTFHMNIEETSFSAPVITAGKKLNYIHITGSDRGMPGEDNVDWNELFKALAATGFKGDLVLENFSSELEGLRGATSLWQPSKYNATDLASGSLDFLETKAKAFGLISAKK